MNEFGPGTIREVLIRERVQLINKKNSRLMRFIGGVYKALKWLTFGRYDYDFMHRAWTTIGRLRIYAPADIDVNDDAIIEQHRSSIEHELIHVRQIRRWRFLMNLSYALLPVPIGLAWCRWRFEREAYLHQIVHYGRDMERVVALLGGGVYFWTWPKPWMRRWFRKQVAAAKAGV